MSVDRKIKSISLPSDVYEHIESNKLIDKFSRWVVDTYKKQFMGEGIKSEIKRISNELDNLRKAKIEKFEQIPERQKNWIIDEGINRFKEFDQKALLKYFNNEFAMDLSFNDFKELIRYYEFRQTDPSPQDE